MLDIILLLNYFIMILIQLKIYWYIIEITKIKFGHEFEIGTNVSYWLVPSKWWLTTQNHNIPNIILKSNSMNFANLAWRLTVRDTARAHECHTLLLAASSITVNDKI